MQTIDCNWHRCSDLIITAFQQVLSLFSSCILLIQSLHRAETKVEASLQPLSPARLQHRQSLIRFRITRQQTLPPSTITCLILMFAHIKSFIAPSSNLYIFSVHHRLRLLKMDHIVTQAFSSITAWLGLQKLWQPLNTKVSSENQSIAANSFLLIFSADVAMATSIEESGLLSLPNCGQDLRALRLLLLIRVPKTK